MYGLPGNAFLVKVPTLSHGIETHVSFSHTFKWRPLSCLTAKEHSVHKNEIEDKKDVTN